MISFNKAITPPADQLLKALKATIESGTLTNNGPQVRQLERDLSQLNGGRKCLLTCNGTIALHLALRAMELEGEIITSPASFVASSSSLIWEGCRPVFADIDPETLCLDPKKVKERINGNTIGILPTHIYGNVCDVLELDAIAEASGLAIIYDGAQAYGSCYNGVSAMNFGHATTLSLHAFKVLSTIEGGAIFSRSTELQDRLFKIRYFGKNLKNEEVMLGTNAKMSELNATYGLLSLRHVENEIKSRKSNVSYYTQHFAQMQGLQLMKIKEEVSWNCAYMPLILPSENVLYELIARGKEKGVEFRRYFYPAINAMKFIGADPAETPIAADISRRIICVPNYSTLKQSDLDKVIAVIKDVLNH